MSVLAMFPMMGQMPSFADPPVPFSAMRYQPPQWWRKQRRWRRPVKQWMDLLESDTAAIEAAAIKRVERRHRRLREMGCSP